MLDKNKVKAISQQFDITEDEVKEGFYLHKGKVAISKTGIFSILNKKIEKGLKCSYRTELLSREETDLVNSLTGMKDNIICKAYFVIYEENHTREFTEYGSINKATGIKNSMNLFHTYPVEMASTRALLRVIKSALQIAYVSEEELSEAPYQANHQKNTKPVEKKVVSKQKKTKEKPKKEIKEEPKQKTISKESSESQKYTNEDFNVMLKKLVRTGAEKKYVTDFFKEVLGFSNSSEVVQDTFLMDSWVKDSIIQEGVEEYKYIIENVPKKELELVLSRDGWNEIDIYDKVRVLKSITKKYKDFVANANTKAKKENKKVEKVEKEIINKKETIKIVEEEKAKDEENEEDEEYSDALF